MRGLHVRQFAASGAILMVALTAGIMACGGTMRPDVGPNEERSRTRAARHQSPVDADTGYAVVSLPFYDSTSGSETIRMGRFAGDLPASLDHYIAYPDTFVTFVKSRGWVGMARAKKCGLFCRKPYVMIQAIEDADSIILAEAGMNGTLIARAVNTRHKPHEETGMERGEQRYLMVHRDGQGGIAARMLILKEGRNGLTLDTLTTQLPSPCPDQPHRHHRFPHADFGTCEDNHGGGGGGTVRAMLARKSWMACVQGCCESNFPYAH